MKSQRVSISFYFTFDDPEEKLSELEKDLMRKFQNLISNSNLKISNIDYVICKKTEEEANGQTKHLVT